MRHQEEKLLGFIKELSTIELSDELKELRVALFRTKQISGDELEIFGSQSPNRKGDYQNFSYQFEDDEVCRLSIELLEMKIAFARQKKIIKSYQYLSKRLNTQFLKQTHNVNNQSESLQLFREMSQRYLSEVRKKTSQLKESEHKERKLEAAFQKQNELLAAEIAKAAEIQSQMLVDKQLIEHLTVRVEALDSENQIFRAELDSKNESNQALLQQNHSLNEEILNKNSKLASFEEALQRLELELKVKNTQIDELNKHLHAVEVVADAYWNKNKKLETKIEELNSKFAFKLLYKDKIDYEEK